MNKIAFITGMMLVCALLFMGCTQTTVRSDVNKTTSLDTNKQVSPQGDAKAPPAEAIAACSGKATNDACTFVSNGSTMTGVCNTVPGVMACAPSQGNNSSGNNSSSGDTNSNQNNAPTTTDTNTTFFTSDSAVCINNTKDNPQCKDCCDCLAGATSEGRKNCRDTCATHDFNQNANFVSFTVPSILGEAGNYSACTAQTSSETCKYCCENTIGLACGDYRHCRTACNTTFGTTAGPSTDLNIAQ